MEIKKRIQKYVLNIAGSKQNIDVGGAMPTVLTVAEQNGKLTMWVELEEDYPGSFNIDIDVIATGQQYETQGKYVGTAIMSNDEEWHVFANKNYIRVDEV